MARGDEEESYHQLRQSILLHMPHSALLSCRSLLASSFESMTQTARSRRTI